MKQLFFIGIFAILLGIVIKSSADLFDWRPNEDPRIVKWEVTIDSLERAIDYNFCLSYAYDEARKSNTNPKVASILKSKRDSVQITNIGLFYVKEMLKDDVYFAKNY